MKAITLPGRTGVQMLLFRREVTLDTVPYTWPVEIAADSRYRLYVNGQRVGDGPCRPSPGLRYTDRRNLAPYLTEGTNVLVVWLAYYPSDEASNADFAGGPVSVLTDNTPFFSLDDPNGVWNTDEQWVGRPAEGYTFTRIVSQLSFMERVDLSAFPVEMYRPDYNVDGWMPATPITVDTSRFALAPRPIPFPYEDEGCFFQGTRDSGSFYWGPLLSNDGIVVPPHMDAWVELDAGMHTTALPVLTFDGGCGARITVTYAESYKQARPDGSLYKGRRDDFGERGVLDGFADCITVDGELRKWMPFWYRTFRFVRLHVRTADQPLHIHPPRLLRTGYAAESVADFRCDNPDYNVIWVNSRRTLDNCMYETFMDCPYYEQLQYVMDTVLQMQYLSKVSHDNRLTRRAMADFFGAQLPDGLLPCNSPAKLTQLIPGFALFAVYMLELYGRRYDDAATVAGYLPAVDRVLAFFEAALDDTGYVTLPQHWCFVDWVHGWNDGSPLTHKNNKHVIYTMMYAAGLRCAARLHRQNRGEDTALQLESRADELCAILRETARDTDGTFFDELPGSRKSQHAQIWAVLSETVTGQEAADLMARTWADESLSKVSYCMVWLLLRAMDKVGLYRSTQSVWERYLSLLSLELTTWPEDDLDARSDCHAWSAVALYEFTAHGLGVRETADGKGLHIRPDMLWLRRCEGSVATRFGTVWVTWSRTDEEFRLSVKANQKVSMHIQLPNGQTESTVAEQATYSIRL